MQAPKKAYIWPLRFWYRYAPDRNQKWMAGYTMSAGEKSVRVIVDGVESAECPRSVMIRDPQAQDLVQIFIQSRTLRGSLGSPSRWPGNLADAFEVLSDQQNIDRSAQMTAK